MSDDQQIVVVSRSEYHALDLYHRPVCASQRRDIHIVASNPYMRRFLAHARAEPCPWCFPEEM